MKWIYMLILTCLMVIPAAQARNAQKPGSNLTPLAITLNAYEKKGFQVIGPVQYLGRTQKQVIFYRHPPVAFTRLETITPDGKSIVLKKYDFVYLLSERQNIVLVRIEKKEADNV